MTETEVWLAVDEYIFENYPDAVTGGDLTDKIADNLFATGREIDMDDVKKAVEATLGKPVESSNEMEF